MFDHVLLKGLMKKGEKDKENENERDKENGSGFVMYRDGGK